MFQWRTKGLVDGAGDLVAAERGDHALDLPPVAEARDIAEIAAALGAHRRLEAGIVTEAVDQLGGVGKGDAAVDEGAIHGRLPSSGAFPDCGRSSSTTR